MPKGEKEEEEQKKKKNRRRKRIEEEEEEEQKKKKIAVKETKIRRVQFSGETMQIFEYNFGAQPYPLRIVEL